MSTNVTRRVDPLEDFFRGFFVRPVDFGGFTPSLSEFSTDAIWLSDSRGPGAVSSGRP